MEPDSTIKAQRPYIPPTINTPINDSETTQVTQKVLNEKRKIEALNSQKVNFTGPKKIKINDASEKLDSISLFNSKFANQRQSSPIADELWQNQFDLIIKKAKSLMAN